MTAKQISKFSKTHNFLKVNKNGCIWFLLLLWQMNTNLVTWRTQSYYLTVLEVRNQKWVSLRLKSRYGKDSVLPRGEFISRFFLLLGASCVPWGHGPFFHPQNASLQPVVPSSCILFITLTLLLPFYEDPCDDFGPTQTVQESSPISRSLTSSHPQSPLCQVRWHVHRLQGLGCGHLWDHYSTCHSVFQEFLLPQAELETHEDLVGLTPRTFDEEQIHSIRTAQALQEEGFAYPNLREAPGSIDEQLLECCKKWCPWLDASWCRTICQALQNDQPPSHLDWSQEPVHWYHRTKRCEM